MKSDIRIDFLNFVEPPDESISYPSGMLYLSACLKNQNYKNIGFSEHVCILRKLTEIENKLPNILTFSRQYFEQKREENQEKLLGYLDKRKPHLLFFGPITTYHLVELFYLIGKIRERYKETVFIAGGPHFGKNISIDRELLDVCQGLDGVVVGEAEETIVEIADLYTSKFVGDEVVMLDYPGFFQFLYPVTDCVRAYPGFLCNFHCGGAGALAELQQDFPVCGVHLDGRGNRAEEGLAVGARLIFAKEVIADEIFSADDSCNLPF